MEDWSRDVAGQERLREGAYRAGQIPLEAGVHPRDLDGEALEAATKELGTSTNCDTANTALRGLTARCRRLRALEDMRSMVAGEALDTEILLNKGKYRPRPARGRHTDGASA